MTTRARGRPSEPGEADPSEEERVENGAPDEAPALAFPLRTQEAARRGPLLAGNASEPPDRGQWTSPRAVDRELPTDCGKPCGKHVEDKPCAVDHSAPATMVVVTGDGDETYAGGPVNALRRIAFLLERRRAETYKVKAFRSAADTILPLGDEVATRVREGTLRKLPGIGASTAEVIEAAVQGRTPDRLAKLERETAGPLVEGGEEVRGRLRGDLHSHSDWSDGGSDRKSVV